MEGYFLKKTQLFIVLLVVLALSASALAQKIEIVYWHAMSGLAEQAIAEQVRQFNESQDRIHVEVEYKGSYRDTLNATQAAVQTGNAPHVIQSFEISTQQLVDMGIFVPLQQTLPAGSVDWQKFLPAVVNYYTFDGVQYSMPYNSSNAIMYYNKDVFAKAGLDPERPPATLEEVFEYSKQIVESGAAPYGMTFPLHSWFVEQWMANIGAILVNNDNGRSGRPTEVLLTQPEVIDIFKWVSSMYDAGYYINPGVENWSQSRQIFAAQQVGMSIDSTAAVSTKLKAGEDNGFEVGTAFIPIPAGYGRHGSTIGGGSLWVLGVHSEEEIAAAGEFVVFLSSPEIQAQWHKDTGYYPVHIDALQVLRDEGWFEANPAYKTAVDQLFESIPSPASFGAAVGVFPEIRTIIVDALQEVFQKTKTVEQALADAKVRGDRAIAEYNRVMGF